MSSSSARHRLALVGLAGLVLAGMVAVPERTSATFTAAATTDGVVATSASCVGEPAQYTSGLLDAAGPLLRWSFGATSGVASDPAGPSGSGTTGLLVCDPADLAAGGDAGPSALRSLDLTGAVGVGATSAPVLPADAVTLLLWVQVGAGDGDLASVSTAGTGADTGAAAPADPAPAVDGPSGVPGPDAGTPADAEPAAAAAEEAPADASADPDAAGPGADAAPESDPPVAAPVPDALVVGVAGDVVQLTQVRDGVTTVLAGAPLTRGETHLVAVVLGAATDGTRLVTLAVDDAAATAPVPTTGPAAGASLTVGARPGAPTPVARVDEVTLLPGEVDPASRAQLLAADRWWSRPAAVPTA